MVANAETLSNSDVFIYVPPMKLLKLENIGFDLFDLFLFLEEGRLMARYCIAYDSMEQFINIKGKASLSEMVSS